MCDFDEYEYNKRMEGKMDKCFNTDCDYWREDGKKNCKEIGLVSFEKCNRFKGDPDPQPDGFNIHQNHAEFETITISLSTREAARDFFTIMQKLEATKNNCGEVELTKRQAKMLVKLCEFVVNGI